MNEAVHVLTLTTLKKTEPFYKIFLKILVLHFILNDNNTFRDNKNVPILSVVAVENVF